MDQLTEKAKLNKILEISVELVTADGKKIRAAEDENTDIFWAVRGGGGNFAVATQFEFKLHEVGPEILAGLIVFPFDQAKQVLSRYREFVATVPGRKRSSDRCIWPQL